MEISKSERGGKRGISPEEWRRSREEWLERQAEEQRYHEKPDCTVLMDWIDDNYEFCYLKYKYKPVVMIEGECKGYIPDMLIQFPLADFEDGGNMVIIDFVNKYSPYYSNEKLREKAERFAKDGYGYYAFSQGILAGKKPEDPKEFLKSIAGKQALIYASAALTFGENTGVLDEFMDSYREANGY